MSEANVTGHVPFLTRLPLARDRPWMGYAVAVGLALLAWFVRWEIGEGLPPGFPFLTFFPAVIVTAFFFGLRPGIVCAALSGLAAWYFFIPPLNSFAVGFDTALALLFYVFIVAVEIALVNWMQAANRDLLIERRRSLDLAENRELLFQELQHRVGNNLQMVASLISLQRRAVVEVHADPVPAGRVGREKRARPFVIEPGMAGQGAFAHQNLRRQPAQLGPERRRQGPAAIGGLADFLRTVQALAVDGDVQDQDAVLAPGLRPHRPGTEHRPARQGGDPDGEPAARHQRGMVRR